MRKKKKRRSLYKPFRSKWLTRYQCATVEGIEDHLMIVAHGDLDEDGMFDEWSNEWGVPITECGHYKLVDTRTETKVFYVPKSAVHREGVMLEYR